MRRPPVRGVDYFDEYEDFDIVFDEEEVYP
jgi:hypothetical protein